MDRQINTAFPRENGESPNLIEVERSRRLYLQRLGILICFVLLFFDGTPKTDTRYLNKEEAVIEQSPRSQSSYITKLNLLVSSTRNLNTQNYYARNITGIYRGHWEVGGMREAFDNTNNISAKKISKAVTIQLRSTKLKNVADLDFVYGVARIYNAGLGGSDLFFPLQGVFLATSGDVFLLSSVQASEMLYLQLPNDVTDPPMNKSSVTQSHSIFASSKFLAVPIENNSSRASLIGDHDINRSIRSTGSERIRDIDDTSTGSRTRRRRRPRLLADDSRSDIEKQLKNTHLATSMSPIDCTVHTQNRQLELRKPELFSLGGIPMPMLHEKLFRLLSTAKSNVRATLQTPSASKPLASDAAPQPSSKPQSLAVGSTGMVIHLIDLAHRPVVIGKVNDSSQQAADPQKSAPELNPNFIEAIGESSLPVTFKNLQRSAAASRFEPGVLGLAFGLSAGANGIAQTCQFAIRLKEPAMELNLAKDQHWQYLNQLLVNVTNTETLRSGGVEITDEDKQRDEARAAAVARKNSAYASMVSGVFESKDCGVIFNISAASFRMELSEVERKASNYSYLASGICFIQIALLIMQLNYSRTQAASTKISILCISAQSMLDAALCIAHLVLCANLPQVFFSHFMWVAILKLLLFGVFEMRTIIIVYQARYAQEASGDGGLQGLRQRLNKVHIRFYAALFTSIFIAFTFRQLPSIAILIFYSYWVPQIVWNTICGTRRTFHLLYCIGTTLSRLFIPLYLLGCPKNFFTVLNPGAIPFSPASCLLLILWSFLQMAVLVAQDYLGPRFFIPANMFPRAYDYYRPVPAHVLRGSHTPVGSSNTSELLPPVDVESGGLIECVICYNVVDTSIGTYMITPCDHLFHKACLEQWLSMKMECCICRAILPPLEES